SDGAMALGVGRKWGASFRIGHWQQVAAVCAESLAKSRRMKQLRIDRVLGGSRYMIVQASTKLLGPQPAMDQPLLVPGCLQRRTSCLGHKIQDMRGTKRHETALCCRGQIRIGLVQCPCPKTEQYRAGTQITLVREVTMQPFAQVATIAYVPSVGVDSNGG